VPFTSTVETVSERPPHAGQLADAALKLALRIEPDSAMPPKKTARFPRAARLLRHADFERVYKQGRRHFSASMTVFYLERMPAGVEAGANARVGAPAPHGLRVGFTVSRALGGAVQRNRMKRRLREAVRLSEWPAIAADVVINPKKSLLAAEFTAVLNEVSRAFVVIEQKLVQKTPGAAANKIGRTRKPEAESRS
jgi:ribonuclease P protein component